MRHLSREVSLNTNQVKKISPVLAARSGQPLRPHTNELAEALSVAQEERELDHTHCRNQLGTLYSVIIQEELNYIFLFIYLLNK